LLVEGAKKIRDALVHPSPYVDPSSKKLEKLAFVTGAGLGAAKQIFGAAREYVLHVEEGIGRDPQQSMPWIFDYTT